MMLQKLNTATKASATALATLLICAGLQIAWLRQGGAPELVIWLPVVVCSVCTWLYADYFVRVRFGVVLNAFARIANGELDLELPPPPDTDVAAVRDAMLRMSGALRDLTQRLHDADAARRRLFADLGHELATPSSTIVALGDALASPTLCATDAQKNDLVAALMGESARLVRLVKDVRDLGQLGDPDVRLERERIDLAELVTSLTQRHRLATPESAQIEVTTAPIVAEVDRARIEQVMTNLLANAARYASGEPRVRVELTRAGKKARIVVEDNGEGVPHEMLEHLGERLRRVDPSRSRRTGGSGLGLSIVRAIVERHGGTTQFGKSSLGGLKVTIEL